jgi:hypothetical protein
MIATVGSLLDGAHARAWELCSQGGDSPADGMSEDRAAALLAAWPRLASATLRALDAVPVEPVWLDDTAAVRQVLAVVAASSGWQAVGVQPPGDVRAPNGNVLAIARRIGLIAERRRGRRDVRHLVIAEVGQQLRFDLWGLPKSESGAHRVFDDRE